jgi:iron complex outermembrane receptor protein
VTTTDRIAHNHGGDVLGRWIHEFSSKSQFQVQAYFQQFEEDYGSGLEYQSVYDLEIQHHVELGERNDIVWGGGYRYTSIRMPPNPVITWIPEHDYLSLFQTFAQDEITLVPARLRVVLGSKFERNDLTGLEIEPNARLLWTPERGGTVWGAVSRATRTPSLFEHGSQVYFGVFPTGFGPPVWVALRGNEHVDVETVLAYELGYRFQPVRSLSVDIAGYYNVYHDLLSYVDEPPVFATTPAPHVVVASHPENLESMHTCGIEISAQWQVLPGWRLRGSYTGFHSRSWPFETAEDDSPLHQGQLHSYIDLPRHFEVNASASYVDAITVTPTETPVRIPSYVRFDVGVGWRPNETFELGLWGQNLLQARHAEFPSVQTPQVVEIPRSVLARINWRF